MTPISIFVKANLFSKQSASVRMCNQNGEQKYYTRALQNQLSHNSQNS